MLIKFRRARIKKWGTLFTYFFTRSAHIEVVHGLDTDSFINSLVRFIIAEENQISDCRTNFKGVVKELEIRLRKVNEFAVKGNIAWNFNPLIGTLSPIW